MSTLKVTFLFALALAVGGATSALAQSRGLEDSDHASRGHPTPSEIVARVPTPRSLVSGVNTIQRGREDADHASRGHPTPSQWEAALQGHHGAYASAGWPAGPAYTGGRQYIGSDPDANVRAQLLRDAPIYRN